jgi:hypothetical protein
VAEELVCYKDRIVIPVKLRAQVLETIHAAHQGVSGMIGRVEETVFCMASAPTSSRRGGAA